MKARENFNRDTLSFSETVIYEIKESLSDLNPPSEAQCVQLCQARADEHQRTVDAKRQEMDDAMRDVMTNVHLILSIGHPDDPLPGPSVSGVPQTIRALIHRRGDQE